MANAPDVSNYYIGKGSVFFKRTGETEFRALGNVPELEFTPEIEKLEHFSSQSGTKTKDKTVVLEKKATIRIVMEEFDPQNVALAFLGTVTAGGSGGDEDISIFSLSEISGALKFVSNNDVGPKYEMNLLSVSFIPSSGISLIGDDWGSMEINGEVQAVNGVFGTMTKTANGA